MLITIYDTYGNKKADISPDDSSTQTKEIQGDNVLALTFTVYEYIDLEVDDYADFEGERYWLTERYRPEQISEREWKYELKLYGVESMIKRLLVIKRVDGEDEPVFTLTAPPREHVVMIVRCMNDGMGNITDWKTGQVDGIENIVIDYFGKYCDEALKEIADKVGAEWWVEGQTINVCRCEHGEQIALGYRKGLFGLDTDKADNVKFYTRLYPVGSSRNIDPDKYGFSRLQLPDGKKYVEINADKYGRVDHYEADAFADIYPRRIGKVSSVRSEEKTGEDGEPFTIYYFKDDDLTFDPNDYELGGRVKRVSFQEGSELGGLGNEEDGTYYFEVNFNSDTREFEIITIWPYDNDTQLPGGRLIPAVGDGYILWNLSMPDEYYGLAEEEFLTAVEKYNEENALDVSVFKGTTDHVWVEANNADLFVGRRVRLESEAYFPASGYRDSRITKITRKVNLPTQMDIEIGDALSKSTMEKLGDSIADVRSYARSIGASVSLPDIIRSGDRTTPTDNNLFSSRRSQHEFLSKEKGGRVNGAVSLAKDVTFGDYCAEASGAQIDKTGNAEFDSIRARGYAEVSGNVTSGENVIADGNLRAGVSTITPKVVSPVFTPETTGSGMSFYVDPATGKAIGWLDELNIRGNLNVVTLLIEELRATYGDIVCSKAAGEVEAVTISSAYQAILKLKDANRFMVGDFVRCWRSEEGEESLRTKSYWLKVYEVSGLTITVGEYSGAILDTDNLPEVGDNVVLMGAEDPASGRDGFTVISGNNGNVGISVYDDVNAPSQTVMDSALKARLGDLNGIQDNTFGALAGHGLFADVAYLKGRIALDTGELVSDAITASSDANTNLLRFTYDRIYTDATPAPGKLNTYQVQRYDVMTTVELVQGQAYTIRAKSNGAFTDTRAQWSLSDADSAENYVSIILFNPNVWKTDGSRKWDAGQEVSDSKTATASGTTFVWQQPTGRYALRILGFGGQKYLEDLMLVKGRRIAPAYTPAPADTEAMAGWASRNLLRNTGDGEGNAKWFSTPEPDESDGSMSQTLHMPNVVSSVKLERGKCYTFRCHTDAQLILPEVARWEALHGDSSIYPNKFASVALWRTVKNADGSVSWTDRRFISSNAESKGRFAPNEPATFFFDGENDNYWVAVESYGEQKVFNKLMLVRGRSISKEWSDAPEDSGDAVTGKIESVKTTLTADIQGFKTETNRQITEYQSDVNTQLTAMQTSIASNGDAIALKADKTTVDQLSGRVDTNAAAIAVMPDQITSQVSATYGGVNILPGTSDQWQEVNVGANMGIAATYNVADLGITANESVVLSFDCKTTSGKKLRARLQWRNSDSDRESYTGHSSDFVQNGAGRLTCAATLPENITDYLYIDVVVDANLTATSLTSSSVELVRCLMLERGSTASATWAPNRGDIARVATEVSQTAEEINLTVKKAEVAAAGMTIDASGITLTGGKTSVKAPDGTDIAMFTVSDGSPTLNTSLVNANELVGRRFIAVDADGAMVSSFNEVGDGCIRHYYPATDADKVCDDDGNFVRWNLHVQQESGPKVIKDSDGNDILTSMRYYDKDGMLLWWLGASGLSANSLPYTFEPLLLAKTDDPDTVRTLPGTTYYLFRSSSTDACTAHGVSQGIHTYASHDMTVYTSSGYKTLSTKATDGVYYSPEYYIFPDVVLPGSGLTAQPEVLGSSGSNIRYYRKSYTIQDGKLTDERMVIIGE